jgi:hypothetical protein
MNNPHQDEPSVLDIPPVIRGLSGIHGNRETAGHEADFARNRRSKTASQ